MKEIRVLLIDDQFLTRIALRSVFAGHPHIRIVGEGSDGEQGVELYRLLQPDVVVLDLRLPRLSGFDVIGILQKEPCPARIVVLSSYCGSEDIYRAMKAGAMSYLCKDASALELVNAIESVNRNVRYLQRLVRDRLSKRISAMELTPREAEILRCISQGFTNSEIANHLNVTTQTVRDHVSVVLDKMGARDRTQATIYALQRGMFHFDWPTD
ncbi:response regulator [Edaphobacter albus]|uniref:response regulator n=1 Tax=Edaphobacter sp. 4G125 TaxID=2763071 RepID=UPI001646C0CC|nr:response regulator transcription factor [Edaphobacter sp. 4G125]QNI37970.1 response regulator transcription factor [Edaphobacter sp. 4G125]